MANGKKTEGEVISYRRIHVTHGRRSHLIHQPNYTILNVRFHDNGNQECSVGTESELPEKILASPCCTVYILWQSTRNINNLCAFIRIFEKNVIN